MELEEVQVEGRRVRRVRRCRLRSWRLRRCILCVSGWRQEEVQRISSTLEGAERKAALCALLEEESRHIASLGSHQQASLLRLQDAATRALLLQVRGHPAHCLTPLTDGVLMHTTAHNLNVPYCVFVCVCVRV